MRLLTVTFSLCIGLLGCAQFPELSTQADDSALNAPFPRLVPIEGVLANAEARASGTVADGPPAGRVAALQARAARLRGPVIDSSTRTRIAQGVVARGL